MYDHKFQSHHHSNITKETHLVMRLMKHKITLSQNTICKLEPFSVQMDSSQTNLTNCILALWFVCIPSPLVYSSRLTWSSSVWAKHVASEVVKVKVMLRPTVPSVSPSWSKAPIWGLRPDLYYCWTVVGLLMWGALSDERTGLSFARLSQQY
jgi:hypothetical protein